MSSFIRLALIPATLSLWSAPAIAKDLPGLPTELLGTYAESLENCQTFFRSLKNKPADDFLVTIFDKKNGIYTYGDCDIVCFAVISSYKKVKNGYVLKMLWQGRSHEVIHLSVTKLGGNKLRILFPPNPPEEVIRCPKPDGYPTLKQSFDSRGHRG